MGVRDKRKKQLEENLSTRELIVFEAEKIIAAKGVEGLRLSDITELVGIQRPSLYSHFSGRSKLLAEVISRAINSIKESFEDNEDLEPLDNIRRWARSLVRQLAAHPAYVRILMLDFATPEGLPEFSETFGPPGTFEETGAMRPLIDRLGNIMARGEENGTLRHYKPLVFFHNLVGLVLVRLAIEQRGVASANMADDLVLELEQSIDDLCVRLLSH